MLESRFRSISSQYDPRVINYDRKMFIRLATGSANINNANQLGVNYSSVKNASINICNIARLPENVEYYNKPFEPNVTLCYN